MKTLEVLQKKLEKAVSGEEKIIEIQRKKEHEYRERVRKMEKEGGGKNNNNAATMNQMLFGLMSKKLGPEASDKLSAALGVSM